MNKGYVYILTNSAMPGLVKVGMTTRNVEQRAKEISDVTGVPMPFDVFSEYAFPDCTAGEREMHRVLGPHRVNHGREFFKIDEFEADKILRKVHLEQVEEWLEYFLPDHMVTSVDSFIDIGGFKPSVYEEASRQNINSHEFIASLYGVDGEELRPALVRHKEKIEQRNSEGNGQNRLRVVGDK